MDAPREIVAREEVPSEGTLLFTVDGVEDGEEAVEGILLELADDVVAFENYCQHWRDVRLDTGDGASLRNGEIVCEKHGAYFETDSGYCNFGPCEGAYLEEIEVDVVDGAVVLADDRYAAPRLGPVEEGGSAAADDDASGSRIGFTGN